ncbi:MAG: DUF3794 domain-containing protein [Clostridia bacterium]|nr:DUF3794 domain-containing protein [Clostridia bacterium]
MTEGTVTKTVWSQSIPQKIEWDLNVPDSKRDILKILSQTIHAYMNDYQIKDNLFTANVTVCANLMYLPEGSEEPQIAALSHTDTVRIKADLPSELSWDGSEIELHVTPHSPVLINSRKLGIRGHLTLTVNLVENIRLPEPSYPGNHLQTLCEVVDTYSTPVLRQEQFPYALSFPLPSGKPPVSEILETSVRIVNPELKAISNKAVIKGDIEVKMLYISTLSSVETVEFSSPFTEILDVGDLEDEYLITYDLKPCILTASILENEENEAKNISFQGMITVQIHAIKPESVSLITDAYSPNYQVKLLKKSAAFEHCCLLPQDNFTLKEILSVSDSQLEEILDVTCTPLLSGAKAEHQKIRLNGILSCRILYRTAGGIHCVTKEIPFEQSRDFPKNEPCSDISAKIELQHFSYHISNHNSIEIRSGITYHICLHSTCDKEYVEAILVDEDAPLQISRAPIVAYIIKPGDTLFQIAKKYATTVDRLKAVNNIDNDKNLKVGSYLIIE